MAVVAGHWLISAPHFLGHEPAYAHLLDLEEWTRWLTWLFQVMPVFFFVGGFSNSVSWESAQRKGLDYNAWFDARIRRLIRGLIDPRHHRMIGLHRVFRRQ